MAMFIHNSCGSEVVITQNRHQYGEYMGGYTETYRECSKCRCILQQHEYMLAPEHDYKNMSGTDVWAAMVNNFLGRS